MTCVGLIVHLGCGGGSPPSSTPATELARHYIDSVSSGDIDTAMSLRCESARIEASERAQFIDEVARLKADAGGQLAIASIDAVATPRLRTVGGQLGEDQIRFRLRLDGSESSGIRLTTVSENGVAKLCGMAVEESFVVRDQLATTSMVVTPRHVNDLRKAAQAATADLGVATTDDAPAAGASDSPAVERWTTAWHTGEFGGGRISMYRSADRDVALAAAQRSVDTLAADAISTFAVPSMTGAIGLRYLGSAWTWTQTADIGPQIDTVIAVHDDVVVTIAVSGLAPDDDHATVLRVVDALAEHVDDH
jgi:hypothetical protein